MQLFGICCRYHRGRHAEIFGSAKSFFPPLLSSFPFTFPFFRLFSFPPLSLRPLRSRPRKYSQEFWGQRSPNGVCGAAPAESEFVHFSLKIWRLVAPILLIFLRINEHTGQLLVEPNALWPTQPKFWVGRGPYRPPGSRWKATTIISTLFGSTSDVSFAVVIRFMYSSLLT